LILLNIQSDSVTLGDTAQRKFYIYPCADRVSNPRHQCSSRSNLSCYFHLPSRQYVVQFVMFCLSLRVQNFPLQQIPPVNLGSNWLVSLRLFHCWWPNVSACPSDHIPGIPTSWADNWPVLCQSACVACLMLSFLVNVPKTTLPWGLFKTLNLVLHGAPPTIREV